MEMQPDLVFSPVIAGTWKWGKWGHQLSTRDQEDLIRKCVDSGITTFDLADIYGDHTTEAEFGDALDMDQRLRDRIQIITKCGIKMPSSNRDYEIKSYDTSREHITWSVDQSLRALKTDRLDLLLIHRPSPLMDGEEIARTIDDLRKTGKVLGFGVSNFSPSQFDLLHAAVPLLTNQVEVSLLHRQPFLDGTFDQCQQYGIRPMAWSPLGSGKLFSRDADAAVLRIREVAEPLIDKYRVQSLDQIYLAWLMRHPSGIYPVLGTARIERIRAAKAASEINLDREDWFRLWTAAHGEEVP